MPLPYLSPSRPKRRNYHPVLNCGLEAVGEPAEICACGIRRGPYDRLRCIRLEQRLPGVLSQIVVTEVDDSERKPHEAAPRLAP